MLLCEGVGFENTPQSARLTGFHVTLLNRHR